MNFILIFLLMLIFGAFAKVWDPTIDPLPPYQPKEMGVTTLNVQYYTLVSNGETVLDIEITGYEFFSYEHLTVVAQAAGMNSGEPNAPLWQVAYENYKNPSAPNASVLVEYNTHTCNYGQIEGNSPYTGYDYYTNLLMGLYESGITIMFDYVDLPEYGLCLKYSAEAPWNNPALPRHIVYTTIFQNSTGYLIEYDLIGTEYCCPGVNFYCPNSGNCSDGSMPQLTYAQTNQSLSMYQIFSESSWPSGFFDPYCPFDTTICTEDDDSSNSNKISTAAACAILFGSLFFVALLLLAVMVYYRTQELRRMQSLQEQLDRSNSRTATVNPMKGTNSVEMQSA